MQTTRHKWDHKHNAIPECKVCGCMKLHSAHYQHGLVAYHIAPNCEVIIQKTKTMNSSVSTLLELNRQELKFITDLKPNTLNKEVDEIWDAEGKKKKDQLPLITLDKYYDKVKSIDPRYDGMGYVTFCCQQKRESFRNYLNDTAACTAGKFKGGKGIFYKICSDDQVAFIQERLQVNTGKPKKVKYSA